MMFTYGNRIGSGHMREGKKNTNKPGTRKRDYFNPYETESRTTRKTYKKYKPDEVNKYRALKESKKKEEPKSKKKVVSKKKAVSKKKQTTTRAVKTPQHSKNVSSSQYLTPEQKRMNMRKQLEISQAQRIRLRNKRRRRMILKMTTLVAVIILSIYGAVNHLYKVQKSKVSTEVVKAGTLDTSVEFEGLIFRNEKVIASEEDGNVSYVVSEGEKVNKEGIVYVLVDQANLDKATLDNENIESDIYKEADKKGELSNYQKERYNLDEQVKQNLEEYYMGIYNTGTGDVYTLRNKLESNILNRTHLYTKEQEEQNNKVAIMKQEIEKNLDKYKKGKAVAASGIISYAMDGNEVENAKAYISKLSEQDFNKLIKGSTPTRLGSEKINKGDPIYKLVLDNNWYIVTYMESQMAQTFIEGNTYSFNMESAFNQPINFKLTSKKEENKKVKLVFETNNQIADFLQQRTIKFSIGEKSASGLKIPVTAVVEQQLLKVPIALTSEEEGYTVVYRKKGEITEKIKLNVQYSQDDMYYIIQNLMDASTIQVNDILVKEDGSTYQVTDMETKQGVYVVNNQIAIFKEIEILVQNNEYAILKYTNSTKLKEEDRIVSNAKGIERNELLTYREG